MINVELSEREVNTPPNPTVALHSLTTNIAKQVLRYKTMAVLYLFDNNPS